MTAGDAGWWPSQPAAGVHLEAFAREPSVSPGEAVSICVSADPPAEVAAAVMRLGWYGGAGARKMWELPGVLGVHAQPRPQPAAPDTPVAAAWAPVLSIPVGLDWPSGVYVVRLEIRSGETAGESVLCPFVVTPSAATAAPILVQLPVTTVQAYNHWGGRSLYPSNSRDETAATRVALHRPTLAWHEANLNARWPFVWDYPFIRWLEREGYEAAYVTDLDTDREPERLLRHRLVVICGHDEYWTGRMRDGFDEAVASGVNIACLGANCAYWQMRVEQGGTVLAQFRDAARDPVADPAAKTVRFRDLADPRPERDLLGVAYEGGMQHPGERRDYRVAAPEDDRWIAGTGLRRGDVVAGVVGYEWDQVADPRPPGLTVLLEHDDPALPAHCVRWDRPDGATVFSAGSLQFSWALDDWRGRDLAHDGVQRMMRRAFDELSGRQG